MENIEVILKNIDITQIGKVFAESVLFDVKDIKSSHFFDREKNRDVSYHEVKDLRKYFQQPGTGSIFLKRAMVGAEFENVLLLIASDGKTGDITINFEEDQFLKGSDGTADKKAEELLAVLFAICKKGDVGEVILGYEPAEDADMTVLRITANQIKM